MFHQFEEGTADRIRYQRVNERTGDEVGYADVVKGADIGGGNYVMLDQDELDSVAPGRSRSLDIHTFVDLDEIDAIYFDKTYFLGPGKEAAKPYALLRDAMEHSGKAAIASFVMRGKEYLAAVRADGGLLALETVLRRRVRDPRAEIDTLPGRGQAVPARGAHGPPAGRHDEAGCGRRWSTATPTPTALTSSSKRRRTRRSSSLPPSRRPRPTCPT